MGPWFVAKKTTNLREDGLTQRDQEERRLALGRADPGASRGAEHEGDDECPAGRAGETDVPVPTTAEAGKQDTAGDHPLGQAVARSFGRPSANPFASPHGVSESAAALQAPNRQPAASPQEIAVRTLSDAPHAPRRPPEAATAAAHAPTRKPSGPPEGTSLHRGEHGATGAAARQQASATEAATLVPQPAMGNNVSGHRSPGFSPFVADTNQRDKPLVKLVSDTRTNGPIHGNQAKKVDRGRMQPGPVSARGGGPRPPRPSEPSSGPRPAGPPRPTDHHREQRLGRLTDAGVGPRPTRPVNPRSDTSVRSRPTRSASQPAGHRESRPAGPGPAGVTTQGRATTKQSTAGAGVERTLAAITVHRDQAMTSANNVEHHAPVHNHKHRATSTQHQQATVSNLRQTGQTREASRQRNNGHNVTFASASETANSGETLRNTEQGKFSARNDSHDLRKYEDHSRRPRNSAKSYGTRIISVSDTDQSHTRTAIGVRPTDDLSSRVQHSTGANTNTEQSSTDRAGPRPSGNGAINSGSKQTVNPNSDHKHTHENSVARSKRNGKLEGQNAGNNRHGNALVTRRNNNRVSSGSSSDDGSPDNTNAKNKQNNKDKVTRAVSNRSANVSHTNASDASDNREASTSNAGPRSVVSRDNPSNTKADKLQSTLSQRNNDPPRVPKPTETTQPDARPRQRTAFELEQLVEVNSRIDLSERQRFPPSGSHTVAEQVEAGRHARVQKAEQTAGAGIVSSSAERQHSAVNRVSPRAGSLAVPQTGKTPGQSLSELSESLDQGRLRGMTSSRSNMDKRTQEENLNRVAPGSREQRHSQAKRETAMRSDNREIRVRMSEQGIGSRQRPKPSGSNTRTDDEHNSRVRRSRSAGSNAPRSSRVQNRGNSAGHGLGRSESENSHSGPDRDDRNRERGVGRSESEHASTGRRGENTAAVPRRAVSAESSDEPHRPSANRDGLTDNERNANAGEGANPDAEHRNSHAFSGPIHVASCSTDSNNVQDNARSSRVVRVDTVNAEVHSERARTAQNTGQTLQSGDPNPSALETSTSDSNTSIRTRPDSEQSQPRLQNLTDSQERARAQERHSGEGAPNVRNISADVMVQSRRPDSDVRDGRPISSERTNGLTESHAGSRTDANDPQVSVRRPEIRNDGETESSRDVQGNRNLRTGESNASSGATTGRVRVETYVTVRRAPPVDGSRAAGSSGDHTATAGTSEDRGMHQASRSADSRANEPSDGPTTRPVASDQINIDIVDHTESGRNQQPPPYATVDVHGRSRNSNRRSNPPTNQVLPDILNSLIQAPHSPPQSESTAARRAVPSVVNRSQPGTAQSGGGAPGRPRPRAPRPTTRLDEGELWWEQCCTKWFCLRCLTVVTTFRYVRVQLRLSCFFSAKICIGCTPLVSSCLGCNLTVREKTTTANATQSCVAG